SGWKKDLKKDYLNQGDKHMRTRWNRKQKFIPLTRRAKNKVKNGWKD
ncbi:hypothetical protein A2U01_0089369, partial [Trifolium medium]|nr:hypothetical protein [Trifolium medium]